MMSIFVTSRPLTVTKVILQYRELSIQTRHWLRLPQILPHVICTLIETLECTWKLLPTTKIGEVACSLWHNLGIMQSLRLKCQRWIIVYDIDKYEPKTCSITTKLSLRFLRCSHVHTVNKLIWREKKKSFNEILISIACVEMRCGLLIVIHVCVSHKQHNVQATKTCLQQEL